MSSAKHELKFIELARKGYYKVLESGEIFRTICKYCGSDYFKKVAYSVDRKGYCHMQFPYQGKKYNVFVHRIVYSFFKGEIPDEFQINHKDGNPGNNDLSNLEAVTPRENIMHAVHVLKTRKTFGSGHPFARLTPVDIAKILYFNHHGTYTLVQLAAKFSVTNKHIHSICKRRKWRSLFDKEYILSGASEGEPKSRGFIFLLSPDEAACFAAPELIRP